MNFATTVSANNPIVTAMKVTFDTNALDKVARPEFARFLTDPHRLDYSRIHDALRTGQIKGNFSDTLITLEGIQRADRVNVLGNTRLESQWQSTGEYSASLTLAVRQDRNPLDDQFSEMVHAVRKIGMRALRGPARIGDGFSVKDDGTFYEPDESVHELIERRAKANEVATAIQARHAGRWIAQSLGLEFSRRDGAFGEWWLQGLLRARDGREYKKVQNAVAEWADGDSIASHVGYKNDLFCTEDLANTAGKASIFATDNRAWLTATYGVAFVTITQLSQRL